MNSPAVLPRYQRADRLAWRDIAGEVIVIDPGRGLMFPLNPVASRVWKLLDGTRAGDDIAQAVREEFDVDADRARRDVDAFIADLVREGLAVPGENPKSQ